MAMNLDQSPLAFEAADQHRGYTSSCPGSPSQLMASAQGQRGRSDYPSYQWPSAPPLQRRDSSASSVRSMIDDRMRMAHEERGRSRCGTPIAAPSPFRSGSPFEQEYAASRRGSTSHDIQLPAITPPPSIASGNKAPSSVSLSELDRASLYEAMRGWCIACQIKVRKANETGAGWPLDCDRRRFHCSNCVRTGDFCSFECQEYKCVRSTQGKLRRRDPPYAASVGGITGYIDHVRRAERCYRHRRCLYCGQITIGQVSDLCKHVLADHRCAYCDNEVPYVDREDLMQHLKEEHLCVDCMLFMSKDKLALHTHNPKDEEILVSIETIHDEDAASPVEEARQTNRLQTRTPSFSPPYMRPRARSLHLMTFEAHERSGWADETDSKSSNPEPRKPLSPMLPTPQLTSGDSSATSSMPSPRTTTTRSQASAAPRPRLLRGSTAPLEQHGRETVPASKKRQASPPTEPNHTCNICSKSFTRRILRDNHLRTHTKERPFTCSFDGCGETFKQKNECSRHEQTKHQEKKFVCGGILECGRRWGCGKKFARSDGLLEHHTRTKKGRRCVEERGDG